MQLSASSAAVGGGGAAAATRGFKGKKIGESRPTKFQPIGGKGKKVAGKGIKEVNEDKIC